MDKLATWMGAVLLFGLASVSNMAKAMEPADTEAVSKLLSETKTLAFQVKEDAAEMETYTWTNVSLETHVTMINQIKDRVNALGRQVQKLNNAKNMASPWQRTAIDRINPLLDELGAYTYAVIDHINGTPKHTAAEYREYLETNADYSAELAAMISNFVDYGKTKEKLARLGAKLELPGDDGTK